MFEWSLEYIVIKCFVGITFLPCFARQLNMSFNSEVPFHHDPIVKRIRDACPYDVDRITLETARRGLNKRPIRIYTDGVFDMFHQGHARHLCEAKNVFNDVHLIVGVYSDATISKTLNSLTVMQEAERYDSVRHCRYADEVLTEAPWSLTDRFIEENKIDFVLRDVNSSISIGDRAELYEQLEKRGILLKTRPQTNATVTSDIVARIVRDYDVYIRRNLARGYSAKELNLSYLNEKKIRLENKMRAMRAKSKRMLNSLGERTDDLMSRWEEKSRDIIENFLVLFKKDSLRKIWNGSKELIKAISPPASRDPSPERSDESVRKRRRSSRGEETNLTGQKASKVDDGGKMKVSKKRKRFH